MLNEKKNAPRVKEAAKQPKQEESAPAPKLSNAKSKKELTLNMDLLKDAQSRPKKRSG